MLVMMPFTTVMVLGIRSPLKNVPVAPIFWVDIVPKPVMSVFGMVEEAVKGLVPLPLTYPVKAVAPVPPFLTASVPARVTTPVVAEAGVNPVVPAEKLRTPVLVMVTFPVGEDTEIPVPAMFERTQVFATVIDPEPLVTEIPAPYPKVLRVYPVPLPISN